MGNSIDVASIVNNPLMWLIALPLGCVVILMAALYMILAYKNAASVGLTHQQCHKGLRSGIFSSIGPSISVFIVVFSMAAIIGGPLTWMRFSVIGAAPVDLAAINLGSDIYAKSVDPESYNSLEALAAGFWTMSINSCGWLIVVFLFNHKMEALREKVGGGDKAWIGLISVTAMLGLFGFLSTPFLVQMNAKTAACLTGFAAMAALTVIGKKIPWVREYALGIAIIIGLIVGSLFS